ncbi:hypothetical protein N0V82_009351 [Gnomoniopsis sp. IMI 355080]|nr:hypothetical protein N0V82_009351 [Gnomoniopsis sp. IMI 355080]
MEKSVEDGVVNSHYESHSLSQLRRRTLTDQQEPFSPISATAPHSATWESTLTLNNNDSSSSLRSPTLASSPFPSTPGFSLDSPSSISKQPLCSSKQQLQQQHHHDGIGSTTTLGRSATDPDSKHTRQAVQHTWALEYVAILLSIFTTIVLLLLLVFADGKPVSRFGGGPSSFLSFNTIISILGALIHAALAYAIGSCLAQEKWNWYKKRPDSLAGFERFEQASRGPWGSLWLILWINVRHWAVLGAIVTIVLLAFEPFLQAVVSFGGKLDGGAGSSGSLPHAPRLAWVQRLDAGVYTDVGGAAAALMLPDGETVALSTFSSQPEMSMVAALYAGFGSGEASSVGLAPSYSCASGNCTWAPFTSLGVCSACNDVSSHLVKAMKNGTNLGTLNNPGVMSIDGMFESYSLPYVNLTNYISDQRFGVEAYMAAQGISNPGLTLSFQDMRTLIAAVGIIKADPSYEQGGTAWNETKVTATECAMYYCAKALNSSVTHNVLQEKTLGTWAERVATSAQPQSAWLGNRTTFAEYEAYNNYSLLFPSGMSATTSYDVPRDDLQVRIPTDALDDDDKKLPSSLKNESLVFNISAASVGSMTNYINNEFFSSPLRPQLVWPRAGETGFSQAPSAQVLYESGDLNATFARAARALTSWMRTYGNLTKSGAQEQWVQHIEVQWAYMIAPLVTFVAGCVFVLLAVAETHKLKLEPWKDDIIALLTHSLNDEMIWKLREAEHEGKSWKMANRTIVRFEDTGNGFELKATQ